MRHDRHFVDELNRRLGEGIGRMVPVEAIAAGADQPRLEVGALEDLVASVARHGVLEPLLVRRRDGSSGAETGDGQGGRATYELISGQRRLAAARAAGLAEVPCVELDVSDHAALEIALIENLQREDLTPFEEAEGFQALVTKYGYTHEQVAQAVGRSRVTVTETLRLLEIPPAARTACRHADVTAKGILLEVAKAGTLERMLALVEAIVERSLDRAAVRDLRQSLELGGDQAIVADPAAPHAAGAGRSHRPFVLRYRHPERRFSLALTFPAATQPEPTEVIAVLEEIIRDLREDAQLVADDSADLAGELASGDETADSPSS